MDLNAHTHTKNSVTNPLRDSSASLPRRLERSCLKASRWGSEADALNAARAVAEKMEWRKVCEVTTSKVNDGNYEAGIIVMERNPATGALQPTAARIFCDTNGHAYLYFTGVTSDMSSSEEAHWIQDLERNTVWYMEYPR